MRYLRKDYLNWNGDTKQHTLVMSFKLPLVNDGIRYLKGKRGNYLRDNKGFKKYEILEGKSDLTNPNYLPVLLNRY